MASERKYKTRVGIVVAASGLLLHVMLMLSIFDIYFRSPIVHNVNAQSPYHVALARRLVLFSVDGLRAESFLEHSYTPLLRSVAQNRGIWGISNTHVPTESRPGHVAIMAGFYEDPSAITRGWKKNPVDFDSVFNRSRYTWSWGADDILQIFSTDTDDGHIFNFAYNTEDQDFSTDKNTTLLDGWVFDKVRNFFDAAKKDETLMSKLQQDKIIIFLHLLGMDTSGHTHKPNSPEFINNMKYVDDGIYEMEQFFDEFYGNDKQTTYIMTSDHGMTDWGSHGASDKHETETPYVIWGAGVAPSISYGDTGSVFGLPVNKRKDISQADFAPLMSTIISVPVPVNSVGKLPIELLEMSVENKAKALYSNSLQLAAQYNTLREKVEQHAISVLYYPYWPLTRDKYNEIVTFTENMFSSEQYDKLIILSQEIMDLSLSGLAYYHNYYQNSLLLFTSLSFFGWITVLLTLLMEQKRNTNRDVSAHGCKYSRVERCVTNMSILLGLLSAFLIVLIFVQRLPIQFYLYSLVPIFLWWRVFTCSNLWIATLEEKVRQRSILNLLIEILCYLFGTIAMVWSFGERWWLSVPLLGMAVWPFVSAERTRLNCRLLTCWATSCLLLGIFSYLPVVGKNTHIQLVLLAGFIWTAVSTYFAFKIVLPMCRSGLVISKEMVVVVVQTILLIVALHNIFVQSRRFAEASPVSALYQATAWTIAGVSVVIPMLSTTRQVCRLFAINSSMLTLYLLLSVSHEGLFLVTLVFNQTCWLFIELRLSHTNRKKITEFMFGKENELQGRRGLMDVERGLTSHDFRRAFFFLLYIILSFFGTGNIASINSFEVRWVTCFITTFHPFLITALILCKTMVPFLIVACYFRAINIITKAPTGYLIVIVLIFSDMMGVQFLHLVRNTGSWLEIGTSISHYVISQVVTVFIIVLYAIAKVLSEKTVSHFIFKSRKKFV